ncbi:MAG: FkbM family methyltransferase [Ignisphaera sp.]
MNVYKIMLALYILARKHGLTNLISIFMKRGKVIFPNGLVININSKNFRDIVSLLLFSAKYGAEVGKDWKVDLESYTITSPDGIRFSLRGFDPLIFAETFLYDIHFIDFDLKGRTVIHAGAYVGETALYYAKKGAIVYAFEPQLDCYNIARYNLELNPELSKNVVLKNWAIGSDGEIEFPNTQCSGSVGIYSSNLQKIKVRSVSISTILKEFKIVNPDILDLDIKGAEFQIIHDKSLEKFKVIRIEYLTIIDGKKVGEVNDIINKLKEYGFNKIRIYKHNELSYSLSINGTILASK